MITPERGGTFGAQITLQQDGIRFAQIDEHEAVQHVGELPVNVKAQNTTAEPGVVLDENGNGLAIALEVGDRIAQLIDLLEPTL